MIMKTIPAAMLALGLACLNNAIAQESTEQKSPSAPIELKDPVAEVNGEKISKGDLENAFNQEVEAAGVKADDLTTEQKLAGYRQILDNLILDKLVEKESSSISVSEAEVKDEIKKIESQFPSPEIFAEQLKSAGQSLDEFEKNIGSMLRQRKWIESQIAGKIAVADEDAKKFYDENTETFERPETVHARHILFLVPRDASQEVVAEKEKAANDAIARLKKGEDFATVAKQLSEEPGADQSGGDLGYFSKDQMVPEFSEAAFTQKPGEISEKPVRTQFGLHIIKVEDKKESGMLSYDEVKHQLIAFLQQAKRRDAVRDVVEGLRDKADIKINLPADGPGQP